MTADFLDAALPHPMRFPDGTLNRGLVHLNRVIDHPNIEIGDFTYASSFDPPDDWAVRLAPYTYAGAPEQLVIGRFCQIADRVRIVTASANHPMAGISTYPFAIFDHARVGDYIDQISGLPDTVIGHDVWIGDGATILPGARIGSGVIIGAGAVVGGLVPDYAVVAGNPARVMRMRFDDATIARLLALQWWHWPPARIARATAALARADVAALEELAA
ncbi:CatB-related O-acetyltransferase [Paracoccus denitrificans]|jgi:virginiamycin A acetyltransferase|uniref:Transferase hexapeptide repeat containing protein n=1 Tax=Paracoccus denitrificans (strain Pd 1222) TaxID=318586 RepID=A1B006_PARDP|nr:CatB-related O-acetyltransferase [Paracoccus denitrificans]ABL68850.1 transferase hexapeptide repeat containing protein [Paracoccus denitrificans PD1222]MBB4625425.1 virginiamycin A acetyltransferase [Paracoccus denitrificans]MCU7428251.1 CatB-related O-acetyltransferase [Paracoccus denitrificans]QAR26896.1 CatB-related O-acetyltransferase [Paracoccus denitrificans]UFS64239.1 CatB-related O-acetyltransferase [Paracoccus denitrificans]